MTFFEQHQPGEAFALSIREWEYVCEASRRVLGGEFPSAVETTVLPHGQTRIWNNGSRPLKQFAILAITNAQYKGRSLVKQIDHAVKDGIEVAGNAPTGSNDETLCIVPRGGIAHQVCQGIVFGPTCARVNVRDTDHRYAQALPGNIDYLESAESGPVRLIAPPERYGLQICYVLLGLPATTTDVTIHAKDLFPAVVYRRYRDGQDADGNAVRTPETYIVCPGGRGSERSIKTVHVLHVEKKTVSTSLFGSLPVAASNFGAVLADDGYGGHMLVCAPGDVDEGSTYPVQRYAFTDEEWAKTNVSQSLAGCPIYLADEKIVVAGGQSAYFVNPVQTSAGGINGSLPMYGHSVTPFWSIDPATGALETRTPRRIIVSGTSQTPENAIVNQEKRFLKQNFTGIPIMRSGEGLSVEFLAVGGTELLGYQSRACVSYRLDPSYGPYVDCENNPVGIATKCEIFPDTPVPFGECCAVRIRRRRSGTMMVDGDWIVCIGGRYRAEESEEITLPDGSTETVTKTVFRFHERPWSLSLDDKAEGWRNDLFPAIPTPRYNAALSDVVTTTEDILDAATGEPTGETRTTSRVFLIGGRSENGLTAAIEALNLETNEWETDWPGLDGRLPFIKE